MGEYINIYLIPLDSFLWSMHLLQDAVWVITVFIWYGYSYVHNDYLLDAPSQVHYLMLTLDENVVRDCFRAMNNMGAQV